MAFFQVQFFSKVLEVASSINVILPEGEQGIGLKGSEAGELPKVLYLLHGYSDDHSIWMRRTSVERYAAKHDLAVVMPAVNHSFYCNEAYGERYWDFISTELPEAVNRFFKVSNKPEDTFVAGLSMGGYGAMRLALTYPERFAAAGSFSGLVDLVSEIRKAPDRHNWERIFGDLNRLEGSEVDTFHLMKNKAGSDKRPRLYVSCGTDDFLFCYHEKFITALRENGWDVTNYEKEGAVHEWGFWDEQIRAFIDFMFEE